MKKLSNKIDSYLIKNQLKKRKKIITLDVSIGNYNQFIDQIIQYSENRESSYVCVSNVHMCIETYFDPNFAKEVNSANLVTPDGMPLAKAIRLIYGIKQDRVAGMDLMPDLIKKAEEKNLGVYFYGGTSEMVMKTKSFISMNYSKLKETHYYSPPFRELSENEEFEIVKMINDSGANILFVALGCPKQEKWMASMKGKINACMIGIGGALPVLIEMQKRAPMWMQKMSLEWVYRLMQEPRRLFRRYFVTNTLFIFLFVKQWFLIKILKKH